MYNNAKIVQLIYSFKKKIESCDEYPCNKTGYCPWNAYVDNYDCPDALLAWLTDGKPEET